MASGLTDAMDAYREAERWMADHPRHCDGNDEPREGNMTMTEDWKPEPDDPDKPGHGSRTLRLPPVRSFGRLEPDKWLLLKTLEESAELVEAGKRFIRIGGPRARRDMLDEWADVLQTLVNTATAFSVTDREIEQAVTDCLERNRAKGRL